MGPRRLRRFNVPWSQSRRFNVPGPRARHGHGLLAAGREGESALQPPALTSCHALVLAVQVKDNDKMPGSVTVLATTFGNYGLAICILNKEQHHA